jgi:hypothetical protein
MRRQDQVDALCVWDAASLTCSYSTAQPTFLALIVLSAIIALVTLPFNKVLELMLSVVRESALSAAALLRTNIVGGDLDDDLSLGDEMRDIQTLRFKVLLSARLSRMRALIDDVTAAQEAHALSFEADKSQWHPPQRETLRRLSSGEGGQGTPLPPARKGSLIDLVGLVRRSSSAEAIRRSLVIAEISLLEGGEVNFLPLKDCSM